MDGGAIALLNSANSQTILSDLTFINNLAFERGGALFSDLSGNM
jgi:predicted outer membrane repeat protein